MPTDLPEWHEYRDPVTGVRMRRLTGYLGHSNHLYFTNPGWWGDGRRLVFQSDRGNRTCLMSIDLESGSLTTLSEEPPGTDLLVAFVNPVHPEAYFWSSNELVGVDLRSATRRELFEVTANQVPVSLSVTADGRYICSAVRDKVAFEHELDLLNGYVGFRDLCEARPTTRVIRIDTQTGTAEVAHEDDRWIGHVNASPTRPDLLSFCHEGPWEIIDQRMWGLNPQQPGEPWKIRPQSPEECIGHEYWLADGERIGYHGWNEPSHRDPFLGSIRFDNTDPIERPFPYDSDHIHSNTPDLIVGDGPGARRSPHVVLWKWDGERYEGPRVLCRHASSRHMQRTHVHPLLTTGNRSVLFTSDRRGYADMYLVEVPPFESLPLADEIA